MMGYVGLQDYTRNRLTINQDPDEWTGSTVRSTEGVGLLVKFSQKKYDRVKVSM